MLYYSQQTHYAILRRSTKSYASRMQGRSIFGAFQVGQIAGRSSSPADGRARMTSASPYFINETSALLMITPKMSSAGAGRKEGRHGQRATCRGAYPPLFNSTMHFVSPFPNERMDDRPHRSAPHAQWSEQIESIAKYLFPLIVPGSVPEKCFWN